MKKIRCGLIGLGYFGKNYLRLLKNIDGAALSAVAARSEKSFTEHADALAGMRATTDTSEIFSDPSIDAVFIVTPAATHYALIEAALRAGKHVCVEKPMVLKFSEAKKIAALVKKTGKTFMVGHQYLYNNYITHLKEKIEKNMLGEVRQMFTEHFMFGPVRPHLGCFIEMAAHELSIVEYLFSPRKITSAQGKKISFSNGKSEDFVAVETTFDKKLTVTIVVSWFMPEKVRRMFFAGTKGSAIFDDRATEGKLKFVLEPYPLKIAGKENGSIFFDANRVKTIVPSVRATEPLRTELENFFECIRSRKEPRSGITHALRVSHWLESIFKTLK